MTTYTIKRGFDLRLAGRAEPAVTELSGPVHVAVETADFAGIKPKALVAVGDRVQTGQPLFLDKLSRTVLWCSPATGTVEAVDYGPRRYLERIVVAAEANDDFYEVPRCDPHADRAGLVAAMQDAGLWPLLRQRPVGKLCNPVDEPAAIFVNGMDYRVTRAVKNRNMMWLKTVMRPLL